MTDKEWFDQLDKIFNPNSPSVVALRDAVERAEHKQEVTFDHFFNNGLKWISLLLVSRQKLKTSPKVITND